MEPEQIYDLFGNRVADARMAANLTQRILGEKVGLSRASVANIEAGRQRVVLHQAIQIAEALGLPSVSELLPSDLVRPITPASPGERYKLSGARLSQSEEDTIQSIVAGS